MQAKVTFGTCVCWSPQSRTRMFKQLYLSEKISEFASEKTNAYIYLVPIHGYIKNKFLTCTREVGDPTLSRNIELKYVVFKGQIERIQMQTNSWRWFKRYGILRFGLMCRQKSHFAHEYAGYRSRERACLNSCISLEIYIWISKWTHKRLRFSVAYPRVHSK